jgi:hypothetical protein
MRREKQSEGVAVLVTILMDAQDNEERDDASGNRLD